MKSFLITTLAAVLALSSAAFAQVQVEKIEPQPAWCGGSYNPTGGLDAQSFQELTPQALPPSGTNFGECTPITGAASGLQGDAMASVPTYPAAPAAQVIFDNGVPILVTTDAEGNQTRTELVSPPVK